jgi:hypothetical protein
MEEQAVDWPNAIFLSLVKDVFETVQIVGHAVFHKLTNLCR